MNAILSSPLQEAGTSLPSSQGSQIQDGDFVRRSQQELSSLSDEALQRYIAQCAAMLIKSHQSGDVQARDTWYHAEADALVERGSRPDVVARLERERGLL